MAVGQTFGLSAWDEQVRDLSYLRLRKERKCGFPYSDDMDSLPNANCTVEQVLKAYPQAISVFFELKTDCVGCHLDKFCTLNEVAAAYELSLAGLTQKLHEAIQNSDT